MPLPDKKTTYVPVLGKVTAGIPITAIENVEDYLPLPEHLVSDDKVYILVIQGDSMIEAGIFDGDMVIVRHQQTANNGDIIVAMTEEDEATVKRFFREKDYIRLQPENSTMEPILLKECKVLGKVIGVFRTIH
jgi:repressor LexA